MKVEAPRRAVTLDEVRAHREVIKRLGERFGVRNIRVFGSVARGEATSGSDLDLLVDVDRGYGYFDIQHPQQRGLAGAGRAEEHRDGRAIERNPQLRIELEAGTEARPARTVQFAGHIAQTRRCSA